MISEAAQQHRPAWLRVDRLLGEHGMPQDTPVSLQEFERHLERGRLEARKLPRSWAAIR